jgi:hypothetical protein
MIDERKQGHEHGGVRSCVGSMLDLGGIECARDGGALALVCLHLRRRGLPFAVAFTPSSRDGFGVAQPPQPQVKHDRCGNDSKARRGEGRGAKERHGNGVLQRGRTWQRRHGERHRAERDGRRHQARWDVSRFEKSLRHRHDHENGDK